MSADERYRFGAYELDTRAQRLLQQGTPVALAPKAFDLLCLFVRNPGKLLSKTELIDALWPRQAVTDASLTQTVYELRRALGGQDSNVRIENVPRRGYRLDAVVEATVAGAETAAIYAEITNVAVLPFYATSGPREAALELGIAATLTAELSRIPGLTVRQNTAPRGLRGIDVLSAARGLGVDIVISGTIQRVGTTLRVTAQLTRVRDAAVLWAQTFECPGAELLELEDRICAELVETLSMPDAPRARTRRPPRDPHVHELYLECRYQWQKWTPSGWLRAIECGREALARDPRHAPSCAWVAASYCTLGIIGVIPPHQAFGEAQALAARSLAIDATLEDAYQVRGAIEHFYLWDWPTAARTLEHALDLNPQDGPTRGLYALTLMLLGRLDEAAQQSQQACKADPFSLIANTGVGEVHFYQGRLREATLAFERTLELDQWFAHARFLLGLSLSLQGEHETGLEAIATAIGHAGAQADVSAPLGYALAAAGRRREACAIRDRLLAQSKQQYVNPFGLALIASALGDADAAFAHLDAAVAARATELVYLRVNPAFATLHGDPRMDGVLARITARPFCTD